MGDGTVKNNNDKKLITLHVRNKIQQMMYDM